MSNGDLALILSATILALPIMGFLGLVFWGYRALTGLLKEGQEQDRPGFPHRRDRDRGPSRPHTPSRRR